MELETGDGKTLRKYLLGHMSSKEQDALELWLMSNDEAYDLLSAAEDDLIDDQLNGKLSGHDLDRFRSYFLAAPSRQSKLEFGRSFQKYVKKVSPGSSQSPPSRRAAIAALFRHFPAAIYAFSALIVLMMAGSAWSAFRVVQLQRQVQLLTTQLAGVGSERDAFRRQLDESRSASEGLQNELQLLERTVADLKSSPAPESLLALNLLPGLSRSSSDIPRIVITPRTRLVQFSLALLDDNYDRYRVVLLDARDQALRTWDGLRSTAAGPNKAVVLTLPGDLLSSGEYSLNLSGITGSQPPESISSFHFRVLR